MAEYPERVLFDLRNQELINIIDFINAALDSSLSMLVHSMDGLSRSPCIMIAYFMVKYLWYVEYVIHINPVVAWLIHEYSGV